MLTLPINNNLKNMEKTIIQQLIDKIILMMKFAIY